MSTENKKTVTQAEAAKILGVSRARVGQYLRHKEHSKSLRTDGEGNIYYEDVVSFRRRTQFSGRPSISQKLQLIKEALQG